MLKKTLFLASWGRKREQGTAVKQAEGDARKSIPRSASTHSRFVSSELDHSSYHTHNCTHSKGT